MVTPGQPVTGDLNWEITRITQRKTKLGDRSYRRNRRNLFIPSSSLTDGIAKPGQSVTGDLNWEITRITQRNIKTGQLPRRTRVASVNAQASAVETLRLSTPLSVIGMRARCCARACSKSVAPLRSEPTANSSGPRQSMS